MIYEDTILAESLLKAYWRLGESAGTAMADASGNGNTGTYSGVTLSQTAPLLISGTAVLFGGGGASVVPHSSSLALTGDITLEAWVKTTFSGTQGGVIMKYATNPFPGYAMAVRGGKISMWVGDNGGGWVNSSASVNNGAWRYVVATLSGTTVKLYIDASLDTTATRTPNRTNTIDLVLGRDSDAVADFITGTLDECAVYAKALSAADITRHYAAASEDPVAGKMAWYAAQHHDRASVIRQAALVKARHAVLPQGTRGDIERADAEDPLPGSRPAWFTQLAVPDLYAADKMAAFAARTAAGSRGDTERPDTIDPLPGVRTMWHVELQLPVKLPRSRQDRRHAYPYHVMGQPPIAETVTADRFSGSALLPPRARQRRSEGAFSTDGFHLLDHEDVLVTAFSVPLSRLVLARRRPLLIPGAAILEPTLIPEDPFNAPSLMWNVALQLPVRIPKARGPRHFYPWGQLVLDPAFAPELPELKFHVPLASRRLVRRPLPPGLALGGIDLDALQRPEVLFPDAYLLKLGLPPLRTRRPVDRSEGDLALLPAFLAESVHADALVRLDVPVPGRLLPRWMTGMVDGSLLEPAGFEIPLIVRAKKYMLAGGFWRARM